MDAAADLSAGVPLRTGAVDTVDTVVASDVIEHLRRPGAFLAECRRILGDGGRLVGNAPCMYWLHEVPHDYFRFTEHGPRELATEAGFAHVEVTVLAGGLDVFVDMAGKLLAPLPGVGPVLARAVQSAWLAVTSVPQTRRAHRRFERRFPLAY
jgi:SAM-dependent methyltransferase